MDAPSHDIQGGMNLISPQIDEILGISKILATQPYPGCGVILGKIIPIGWMKVANRRTENEFYGREEEKKCKY